MVFIIVNMHARPSCCVPIEPAARPILLAQHHRARRARANTHLVLERDRPNVVRLQPESSPIRAAVSGTLLRHQKQRNPFEALRRIRRAREHEVHDVVREIVIAPARCRSSGRTSRQLPSPDASGSARVRNVDKSDPACGSVSAIDAVHSPLTSCGRYASRTTRQAHDGASASTAPIDTSGHIANARFAPAHISPVAAATSVGSPMPPSSAGALSEVQPSARKRR